MALVPIVSQSWDTTSVFTPTRMNNIEQNLAIVSKATGVEYSNGVSVKDKIDSMNTLKTGNLLNGSDYSTYVRENYSAKYYEKNGVVVVKVNIVLYGVSAGSGWKAIFNLPNNVSRPLQNEAVNVVTSNNTMQQFRIGTDGTVNLNGTIETHNYENYVAEISYMV